MQLTNVELNIIKGLCIDQADRVYITLVKNKMILMYYYKNTFKYIKVCNKCRNAFKEKHLNEFIVFGDASYDM